MTLSSAATIRGNTSVAIHNWELYKENAAPLERGRNVSILSKVLSSPTSESTNAKKEQDRNIRNFESLIRPTEKFYKYYTKQEDKNMRNEMRGNKGRNRNHRHDEEHSSRSDKIDVEELLVKCKVGKDPIIHWLKYIKYHEDTYPSDTHAQFLIMERCMHSLFHIPIYRNDTRYIRVCVLYADKTSDPHEQFKLFHKHKIGEYVAIFWLAWAWVAEKKKDFPFAEKIFRKAMQKEAKPAKIIQERHKQFLRRMSRHWLDNAAQQQQHQEEGMAGYDNHDEDDEENRRGVLTGLTEEGVRQNNRARGLNTYHRSNMGQNVLTTRNGQSNLNRDNNGVVPKSSFSVFNDENEENDHGGYDLNQSMVQANDENKMPIPRIVKEQDRKKENTLSAEAWNERGGLNSHNLGHDLDNGIVQEQGAQSSVARRWAGTGSDSIIAGGTSSQPAFQVFVDEDCAQKDKKSSRMKRPASRGRGSERTLRQRLDECTTAREPLRLVSSSSDESTSKGDAKRCTRIPSTSIMPRKERSSSNTRQIKNGIEERKPFNASDHGEYKSFEEKRAELQYFTIISSDSNFNMLQRQDEKYKEHIEDSCADMDVSSIEMIAVEEYDDENQSSQAINDENQPPSRKTMSVLNMTAFHDQKAALNVTTLHGTVCDSIVKQSNPRKVLFDINTSFGNRSVVSNANNTSTVSSEINESEAVGIHNDKEETVNTKFAARELSMMFSSPAVNESTNESRVRQLSNKSSSKLLFSIHRDKHYVNDSNDSSTADLNDEVFAIYRDNQQDKTCDEQRGVFKIFEETSSAETSKDNSPAQLGFKIHNDSDSNSSGEGFEEREKEDFASFDDIRNLMEEMKHNNSPGIKNGEVGFQVFCDEDIDDNKDSKNSSVCGGVDDGTVLTEDIAAFGRDISCILQNKDGDTMTLQDGVSQLSITDGLEHGIYRR